MTILERQGFENQFIKFAHMTVDPSVKTEMFLQEYCSFIESLPSGAK
jgi:hypothetical protein